MKRSGIKDADQLGFFASTMSEFMLFQHVHYFHKRNAITAYNTDDTILTPSNHIIEPIGMFKLTRTDFNESSRLRELFLAEENDTNGSSNLADITDAIPTSGLHYLAFSPVLISLSTILEVNCCYTSTSKNGEKERFDYIINHISTSTTTSSYFNDINGNGSRESPHFDKILSTNQGLVLSPYFAVDLCRDLLCAADHLISW